MADYRTVWGSRIRVARMAAGLSQREVAVALEVDQAIVSRWERGQNVPRVDRQLLLARLLGVNVNDLFSHPEEGENGEAA
ncbi:MAG: helix-turn-helix domain-containing protein [Chloroflexi bacterium]|nr:helix-turn-helix domain-containing protein [Chloroflexota bacterium]